MFRPLLPKSFSKGQVLVWLITAFLFVDIVFLDYSKSLLIFVPNYVLVSQKIENSGKYTWNIDSTKTWFYSDWWIELQIDGDNTKMTSDLSKFDFSLRLSYLTQDEHGTKINRQASLESHNGDLSRKTTSSTILSTGKEFRYYLDSIKVPFLQDETISFELNTSDAELIKLRPKIELRPFYQDIFYGEVFIYLVKLAIFFVIISAQLLFFVVRFVVKITEKRNAPS